jgi:choline dehydrogenase
MIFNRGNPMDQTAGDDGLADWNYAHCLPYFRKRNDIRVGRTTGAVVRPAAHQPLPGQALYDAFLCSGEQAGFEVTRTTTDTAKGMHVAVVHPQRAAVEFVARLLATGHRWATFG